MGVRCLGCVTCCLESFFFSEQYKVLFQLSQIVAAFWGSECLSVRRTTIYVLLWNNWEYSPKSHMALGIKRITATPYDPQPPHLSGHLDQIAHTFICTVYHLPTIKNVLVNNSTNSLCSHDWNGKIYVWNVFQGTVLSNKMPSHSLSYDHYEVSLKLYLDSGISSEFTVL
jgi:hypothetical protein